MGTAVTFDALAEVVEVATGFGFGARRSTAADGFREAAAEEADADAVGVGVGVAVWVGVAAGVGCATASVTGAPSRIFVPGGGSWRMTTQSSPALDGCGLFEKCAASSAAVAWASVLPLTDGTSPVFGGAATVMSTRSRTTSAPGSGTWSMIE